MKYPKVSIITINYNGLKDTIECLDSLKKIDYPNYEVFVVDNASDNKEGDKLKEKFKDNIRLIKSDYLQYPQYLMDQKIILHFLYFLLILYDL